MIFFNKNHLRLNVNYIIKRVFHNRYKPQQKDEGLDTGFNISAKYTIRWVILNPFIVCTKLQLQRFGMANWGKKIVGIGIHKKADLVWSAMQSSEVPFIWLFVSDEDFLSSRGRFFVIFSEIIEFNFDQLFHI